MASKSVMFASNDLGNGGFLWVMALNDFGNVGSLKDTASHDF